MSDLFLPLLSHMGRKGVIEGFSIIVLSVPRQMTADGGGRSAFER